MKRCPWCDAPSHVYWCHTKVGETIRYRECKTCYKRWKTVEIFVKHIKDRKHGPL